MNRTRIRVCFWRNGCPGSHWQHSKAIASATYCTRYSATRAKGTFVSHAQVLETKHPLRACVICKCCASVVQVLHVTLVAEVIGFQPCAVLHLHMHKRSPVTLTFVCAAFSAETSCFGALDDVHDVLSTCNLKFADCTWCKLSNFPVVSSILISGSPGTWKADIDWSFDCALRGMTRVVCENIQND